MTQGWGVICHIAQRIWVGNPNIYDSHLFFLRHYLPQCFLKWSCFMDSPREYSEKQLVFLKKIIRACRSVCLCKESVQNRESIPLSMKFAPWISFHFIPFHFIPFFVSLIFLSHWACHIRTCNEVLTLLFSTIFNKWSKLAKSQSFKGVIYENKTVSQY